MTEAEAGGAKPNSGRPCRGPYLACPGSELGTPSKATRAPSPGLAKRITGGASAMPHNAFFGVSNYVTATVAIVIVVVVVAVWWLRSRRK